LNLDGRDTNYLMIFERRILRNTFGPVQETDGWRIRTNYKLNSGANLHRMEGYRMVRRILNGVLKNIRVQG